MKSNLALLALDWRAGGMLKRYFMASLIASGLVSLACSLLSFVALSLESKAAALGFVCVSGACLMHAVGTWNVLKRRYQVRFAVF